MAISALHRALGEKILLESKDIPDDTVIQSDILDGSINNDKLADDTIQAGKVDFFLSTGIDGTGSEVDTAHGLGRTPTCVVVYLTQKDDGATVELVEGTHDGTNIKVNAPTTVKYGILAF